MGIIAFDEIRTRVVDLSSNRTEILEAINAFEACGPPRTSCLTVIHEALAEAATYLEVRASMGQVQVWARLERGNVCLRQRRSLAVPSHTE